MKKSILVVAASAALFFVGVVGFVSLIAGSFLFSTTEIVDSADSFFQSAAIGDNRAARDFMAVEFSNSITESELASFITENQFDQFVSSDWTQRSITNSEGELEGNITTKTGAEIPLVVSLIDEQGQWKIREIQRSDSLITGVNEDLQPEADKQAMAGNENEPGDSVAKSRLTEARKLMNGSSAKTPVTMPLATLQTPVNSDNATIDSLEPAGFHETTEILEINNGVLTTADIPDNWKAASIVKQWTVDFCSGISDHDFSEFHAKTTPEFQAQVPLNKFTQIFNRFLDNEIDMMWVRTVEPEFIRPPAIDADGVLRLEGNFPAEPPVKFDYSFKKTSDDWQLLDINLVVNPSSEDLVIPSMDVLAQLVIDQTKRFGKAIRNQDFTPFHQSTSQPFRNEINLLKFSTIFKKFFETNADLAWIGSSQPVFDAPISLNTSGKLSMKGYFPVEPRVDFKYGFIKEDSVWKITAINISIPGNDNVVE